MCIILCIQRPHKATQEEMTKFHSDDYIKFLRSIRPDNMSEFNKQMQRCVYILFFIVTVSLSYWSCVLYLTEVEVVLAGIIVSYHRLQSLHFNYSSN